MALKKFSQQELLLSKHQAWVVFRFFFTGSQIPEASITEQDRAMAQALLVEAIDASYAMGYFKIVFDTFYMRVPGSFGEIGGLVKSFAKKAAKQWFKNAVNKDPMKVEIYEAVRRSVAYQYGGAFAVRAQLGNWDGSD